MEKVTVELTGDRKKLSEGRTYGLGFAFCKKIKDGAFATVQAPSTCKDYLNDVVFVESLNNKKSMTVYGLKYQFNNLFKENKAYLLIKPLESHASMPGMPEVPGALKMKYDLNWEKKNLNNKVGHIEKCLNTFEEHMGFKSKTIVMEAEDGAYLLDVPMEWVANPYCISLYSLLIRHIQYVDFTNILSTVIASSTTDTMIAQVRSKINHIMFTKKMPEYDDNLIKSAEDYSVHNAGIMKWNIPLEKTQAKAYISNTAMELVLPVDVE